MGYCKHKTQQTNQIYTKINNDKVPEVPEKQKRIKQDYESVRNQVMESSMHSVKVPDKQIDKTVKFKIY